MMSLNYIIKNKQKNIPSYIIAEVAQAHDGSIGFAHSFIDLAAPQNATLQNFKFTLLLKKAQNKIL